MPSVTRDRISACATESHMPEWLGSLNFNSANGSLILRTSLRGTARTWVGLALGGCEHRISWIGENELHRNCARTLHGEAVRYILPVGPGSQ
jgi:hypothetical protein